MAPESIASRLFDIGGRVAVVTGASSGLGEGLARALAAAGARVAVVARRRIGWRSWLSEIEGLPVCCDLLDLDALARWSLEWPRPWGRPRSW